MTVVHYAHNQDYNMTPVNSNTKDKKCPGVISSGCVTWDGCRIQGLCEPVMLNDVICKIKETTSSIAPCYTGTWVDFSSSIPAAGTAFSATWTTSNMGSSFRGIYGLTGGTNAENNPQYRWTKDGNLELRGTFAFNINSSVTSGFIAIPLVSLLTSCFPSTWTAAQSVFCNVDIYPGEGNLSGPAIRGAATLDYPSGIIYLNTSYANGIGTNTFAVLLGGITFNL